MTNKGRLTNLINEENIAAQKAGFPYLSSGKKTIEKITAEISDETADKVVDALTSGALRKKYESGSTANDATEEEQARGWLEYVLWEIYFIDRSSREGSISWPTMQEALLDIYEQGIPFYKAAQNRVTNALPQFFLSTNKQLTLFGEQTASVGRRQSNAITFTIQNAEKHEMTTTTKMLFDVFLIDFAKHHGASTEITVRQYAQMRGIEPTKNALQALARQANADVHTLADISAKWKDKNGTWLTRELNGGTHGVYQGVIYWNWNSQFLPFLENLAPMEYSQETLTADPRKSTYYFSRYLDVNYRRNEEKQSLEKIYISTLLEQTPYIPDIDEAKRQRINVKDRIIGRFFKSLDDISRIYYDVYTEDGELVEDPLQMDIEQFRKGYILVDFSDYQKHPDRIKAREKRKKKATKKRAT